MESANSHHHQLHHQLQDHHHAQFLVAASSSSSSSLGANPSSFHGAAAGTSSASDSWNPLVLNAGNFDLNANGFLSTSSRNIRQDSDNIIVPPSLNASTIQDHLGFYWATNTGSFTNQSAQDQLHNIAKIKEELSDSSSKFSDQTSNCSSNPEEFHLSSKSNHGSKYEQQQTDFHGTLSDQKLLLRSFSGCNLINNGLQLSPGESYSSATSSQGSDCFGGLATHSSSRGNLNHQIFPSTNNVSSLQNNSSLMPLWGSLGMNLQAFGLLGSSTKLGGSFSQQASHNNNLGLFKERSSFGLDLLQDHSSHWSTNSQNNTSSFMSEITETKRGSNVSEPKASPTAPKKPRVESRSSLTPIKVRKEKLGDRIAALQQLVAPFGKTDTASVLMEAIGYIKFLQDQVETLSVPYMKSARNRTRRTTQEGSSDQESEGEGKRDLRSSGLCLVPLSCMSYIANDSIGVWPPPNFGGRT